MMNKDKEERERERLIMEETLKGKDEYEALNLYGSGSSTKDA